MSRKRIVLFGIGPGVQSELYSLPLASGGYDYMAVGMDAVNIVPWPLKYIVTNHLEDIPEIHRRRASVRRDTDYKIVSYTQAPGVDIYLECPYEGPSGSSSIVGTLVALQLGYEKIILCGIPLTGNAFEGNPYEAFRPGWEYHKDKFVDKVRSMSGWTAELLGVPTIEWVYK